MAKSWSFTDQDTKHMNAAAISQLVGQAKPVEPEDFVPGRWYRFIPDTNCVIQIIAGDKIRLFEQQHIDVFLLSEKIGSGQITTGSMFHTVKCGVGDQVVQLIISNMYNAATSFPESNGTFYLLEEVPAIEVEDEEAVE